MDTDPMNLHEAIASYRLTLDASGRSTHTLLQIDRHLRRFREWLGDPIDRDITTIGAEFVARFFTSDAARLSARGGVKRPTSMNALRSSIRSFFGFLHDAGHVAANPARLLRRARCSDPPPRGIPVVDEERLLRVIDLEPEPAARRDAALVRLLSRTGLRISSALAILVEDVDAATGEIEIRESKGGKRDRIPVSTATVRMLLDLASDRASGPIFVGKAGKAIDRRHFARRLGDWARKAGIEKRVHPHAFRHGLAMRLLDATDDLRLVQQALRHRSIASTTRYAEVAGSKVRTALLQVERAG